MSVEAPAVVAMMATMPQAKDMAAGMLVLMAVSLFIESPVIDLLSTAATFARGSAGVKAVGRFASQLILLVTVAHGLFVFTPLYDFVLGEVLRLPDNIVQLSRVPLQIMTPWSGLIGWRRWRQGVMIRHGNTRAISVGTGIRFAAMLTSGFGLAATHRFTGLQVAAFALIFSVAVEALFVHFASRPALDEQAEAENPNGEITVARLYRFHAPLTLSTMAVLSVPSLIGGALARVENPVLAMAAWQVATSLAFVFRTVTFALPEVVITLADQVPPGNKVLLGFCAGVGGVFSVFTGLASLTGFDWLIFTQVMGQSGIIVPEARTAFLWCVALPFLASIGGYLKGQLSANHLNVGRLYGIAFSIASVFATLQAGVLMRLPGVILAPLAVTVGHILEVVTQGYFLRRGTR